MRRMINLLPHGTLLVGTGVGLLGLAAYVQLAIAGHALVQQDMAALAVLWSIVFALAPGLFLPLEQELTRLIADRRALGNPIRPVLSKGLALAGGAACILLVTAMMAREFVADTFFHGNQSLVWVMCAALGVHAVAHASRGALAGLGEFGWYGAQLAVDGAVRLLGTALVASSESVSTFAWLLVIAPAVSVAATMLPVIRASTPGTPLPWAALSGRLGLLTTSAFLNQLMINIAVINAHLLSDGNSAVAFALLAAMILARMPVFLFGAMHPALLSGAATAFAQQDWAGLRTLTRRAIIAVSAIVAAVAAVVIPVGPQVSVWLFNAPDVLTSVDFVLLSAAVGAYLWAFVLGQVAVAMHRHGSQASAWIAGSLVLLAMNLLPMPVSLRVELAFLCGALTTALVLGVRLRQGARAQQRLAALVPEVAQR